MDDAQGMQIAHSTSNVCGVGVDESLWKRFFAFPFVQRVVQISPSDIFCYQETILLCESRSNDVDQTGMSQKAKQELLEPHSLYAGGRLASSSRLRGKTL